MSRRRKLDGGAPRTLISPEPRSSLHRAGKRAGRPVRSCGERAGLTPGTRAVRPWRSTVTLAPVGGNRSGRLPTASRSQPLRAQKEPGARERRKPAASLPPILGARLAVLPYEVPGRVSRGRSWSLRILYSLEPRRASEVLPQRTPPRRNPEYRERRPFFTEPSRARHRAQRFFSPRVLSHALCSSLRVLDC